MSIHKDLERNRRIYRVLSGSREDFRRGDPPEMDQPRQDNREISAVEESGWMSHADFARRMAELELPAPGDSHRADVPVERYSLTRPAIVSRRPDSEAHPLSPPAPTGEAGQRGGAEDGDGPEEEALLDNLLRRLESNARRYPQNLTGEA